MKSISLTDLAKKIDAQLIGDGSVEITELTSFDQADENKLSYMENVKHLNKLEKSKTAGVIVAAKIDNFPKPQLVVKNVQAAVIDVLNLFAPKLTPPAAGIHPSAVLESSAKIASSASIGANAYIGHNVSIGENSIICPNVSIGENTTIANNTRIDANVVIYHNCKIGANCIIQAGAIIGALGYGYSFLDGQHKLIPHNGGVIIEDCVHVGANCCIDRGKFGDTIIGAGTKMDNLIQIGHGAKIGMCCLIVAQVAIGGSAKLGNGVVVAGQTGIANLVEIGDLARIGARSGVMADVPAGSDVLGAPAIDAREAMKQSVAVSKLPELIKQVKLLTKKVEKLESSADN